MGKVVTMREAISRLVGDGDKVAIGLSLEHAIPFSAGHEIIRQGKRGLTLIGPISDALFDQLIGAGCVSRVMAAWVGNVAGGLAYNYKRAVEQGLIEVVPYSNLSLALALRAAAMGVPFLPTYSLLGSDILRDNKTIKKGRCPFTGDRIALVKALSPDVAIVHVQRCDEDGNCHLWGNLGLVREAVMASARVIVVAEELVDGRVIRSNPNMVPFPSYKVSAVVVEPFGAHPSPLIGYYNRDHGFFEEYSRRARTREGFEAWLSEWVFGVRDRAEYIGKIDVNSLRPIRAVVGEAPLYGY